MGGGRKGAMDRMRCSLLQHSITPLSRRLDGVSPYQSMLANISPVERRSAEPLTNSAKANFATRLCAVTLAELLARFSFRTTSRRFRSSSWLLARFILRHFLFGRSSRTSARNFNVSELQIRERVPQHGRFFVAQVTTRFFLNHRHLIDKHFRVLKLYLTLSGLRIGNLAKKKRGVLRLHHDKFDESLRQFSGIRAGLNFGHILKSAFKSSITLTPNPLPLGEGSDEGSSV